jgi:RNA polymerase sigma-70 factor (ECF subfamily)
LNSINDKKEVMMIINFKKKMSRQKEKLYLDLVQKTQEQLYKMAFTYVHNKEDALDIVQDTIYKGYISYHKLKDRSYEKTGLIRILINTSLDFIKKQKGLVLLD